MRDPASLPDPPLVAVVRVTDGRAVSDEHLLALASAGLTVEVAMACGGASELMERAVRSLGGRAMVGAGTVLGQGDAEQAEAAGAQFATSPGMWPGLEARPIPAIPGVFTPTEVIGAIARGFRVLKLFPARLGPQHLSDLRTVFPNAAFLPSGGVSEGNVGHWRAAGAAGAFVGGSLFDDRTLVDPGVLEERARGLVAAWRSADPLSRTPSRS